jgi:hypothetical protein
MMISPVGGHFMAPVVNFLYKAWHPLGDPAQDKKGGLGFKGMGIKDIKEFMGIGLHPELPGGPGVQRNISLEILHLKPVFHIKGQKNRFVGFIIFQI